jgi:hypothetical protein
VRPSEKRETKNKEDYYLFSLEDSGELKGIKTKRKRGTMSSFDLCCPGPSSKAPQPQGKNYNDDPQAVSDEDSYGPTPPPPPTDPHPDDVRSTETANSNFNDEYGRSDMEKGPDPPQETTQEVVSDNEDDQSGEFEEDQSVEIPPTKIVKRMVRKETGKGGGSCTLWAAGCVACCLVIIALVLGIGFGTGAFSEDEDASRAPPEIPDIPPETTVPPPEVIPEPVGPQPAVDPAQFAGLSVFEFIPAISLADPSVFDDLDSVESRALNYVANAGLGFDTDIEADRTRIIQLYSLRTLWWASELDWVDETGWTTSTDECTWFGVTCDETGIVTDITMPANGLTGSLPPDLARLSSLRTLTVTDNEIEGPLPEYLFTMPALEEVYLDGNLIDDEITYATGMISLRVFRADGNNLSGNISVFWYVPSLEVLILDDNGFTGTLDGISALQNLCKCRYPWKTIPNYAILTYDCSFLYPFSISVQLGLQLATIKLQDPSLLNSVICPIWKSSGSSIMVLRARFRPVWVTWSVLSPWMFTEMNWREVSPPKSLLFQILRR